MIYNLNLLHLVLAGGAIGCVALALQEVRGRPMGPGRLFLLPGLAMLLAAILLLFHLADRQPLWLFGAAFGLGVAAGAVRGATTRLQVDQTWMLVRPAGRKTLAWVSLLLPVAAGFEIGGAIAGPDGLLWRLIASELAALAAGLMLGRAAALGLRLWHAPHVDLRRR